MSIRVDRDRLARDAGGERLIGLLEASMDSVDPGELIRKSVLCSRDRLHVCGREISPPARRLWVFAVGKAALAMAAALVDVAGNRLAGGYVLTRHGYGGSLRGLPVAEGGHPIPDEAGFEASSRISRTADRLGEDDVAFCLISGGGSALLAAPADGLGLEDLRETTALLLHSGLPIDEMNAVRRHLSSLQGGGLAAKLWPARTVTLILSDVVLGGPEAIASGPTVADPSTFADARSILERASLWERVPDAVRLRIRNGCAGRVPETVKPGDRALARGIVEMVGSNRTIVKAACERAKPLGYRVECLSDPIIGEARDAGRALARRAIEAQRSAQEPVLIIGGGETTVTVTGEGTGGRNQEFALAAGLEIAGRDGIRVAALATDGTDGPTDAAGALVSGSAVSLAAAAGLDPQASLSNNDAYAFLRAACALLFTGPTGTNVADLYVAEVQPS